MGLQLLGAASSLIGSAGGLLGIGGNDVAGAKASREQGVRDLAARAQQGNLHAYYALGALAGYPSPVSDPAFSDGRGGGGKPGGTLTAGRASDWVGRADRPWQLAQQLYNQLTPQFAATATVIGAPGTITGGVDGQAPAPTTALTAMQGFASLPWYWWVLLAALLLYILARR